MKRTSLLATIVGFAAIAAVPPDASAYYHAQMGRFINRDPIGYRADDVNQCRYVASRPLLLTDPSGLARCCAVKSFSVERTGCHHEPSTTFYGDIITVTGTFAGDRACCEYRLYKSGFAYVGSYKAYPTGGFSWEAGEAVEQTRHPHVVGDTLHQTIHAGVPGTWSHPDGDA